MGKKATPPRSRQVGLLPLQVQGEVSSHGTLELVLNHMEAHQLQWGSAGWRPWLKPTYIGCLPFSPAQSRALAELSEENPLKPAHASAGPRLGSLLRAHARLRVLKRDAGVGAGHAGPGKKTKVLATARCSV